MSRTVIPGGMTTVEYRRTNYEETLRPVLTVLAEWGLQHLETGSPRGDRRGPS